MKRSNIKGKILCTVAYKHRMSKKVKKLLVAEDGAVYEIRSENSCSYVRVISIKRFKKDIALYGYFEDHDALYWKIIGKEDLEVLEKQYKELRSKAEFKKANSMTLEEVYNTMNKKQKRACAMLVDLAIKGTKMVYLKED